jgi:hypothetical protein
MASSDMLLPVALLLLYVLCMGRAVGTSTASNAASERDVLNKATTIDENASATGAAKDKNMLAGIDDCRYVCGTGRDMHCASVICMVCVVCGVILSP